jgi:hypothetical protein
MVIAYDEAYAILRHHRSVSAVERSAELDELFQCVILSYFSSHAFEEVGETHSRHYHHLLEGNDLLNFEYSEVGHRIITAIMETTREYLPGYAAHNQHHIARIFNAEMRSRCTLLIEVDALALEWFLRPKSYSLGV